MNTYNLNSATKLLNVSMQNKPITDMENIQWEEAIYTDNGLWVAIDDKGYSYKFDENGTLINKKRVHKGRRHWDILRPTHGKNYGMTVLVSTLDYYNPYSKYDEYEALRAYQKDGSADWICLSAFDQDEDLVNWYDLQGYWY